jgi:hypothetical protein
MKTKNYQDLYRHAFGALGYPLGARDGISSAKVAAAEKKLGARLPAALRDYCLMAGRERVLNHAFNRLCMPSDWEVHSGKLVFMVENQCVVVWGVAASSRPANDPAVFQGPVVDGEVSGWFLEDRKCSAFLVFMLHLQAAYGGGMAFTASAPAPQSTLATLDRGWHFAGEVNGMRAYGRNGQAVCFVKWSDFLSKKKTWRVFAGASTKAGLAATATDLRLEWD